MEGKKRGVGITHDKENRMKWGEGEGEGVGVAYDEENRSEWGEGGGWEWLTMKKIG